MWAADVACTLLSVALPPRDAVADAGHQQQPCVATGPLLRAAAGGRAARLPLRPWATCSRRAAPMATTGAGASTVWWLRKGLRLHDNPALLAALEGASSLQPLFILDPHFTKPQVVGAARLRFLLESLHDLDASLRKRNSRLIVLHGAPGLAGCLRAHAWVSRARLDLRRAQRGAAGGAQGVGSRTAVLRVGLRAVCADARRRRGTRRAGARLQGAWRDVLCTLVGLPV